MVRVTSRILQIFLGIHPFDLTQDEGHPLIGWNPVQTAVNSLPHLGIVDLRVHRERWSRPAPGVIKPLLEDFLDVVHLVVSPQIPPRCGNLLVQDAEQPGPDMGSALESGRRLDEGDEGLLRDVLGQLRGEAGTAGGAEDLR